MSGEDAEVGSTTGETLGGRRGDEARRTAGDESTKSERGPNVHGGTL